MHLAYIWIVSHLSAKNYRNLWKFDEVLTKTNLLSFFLGHGVVAFLYIKTKTKGSRNVEWKYLSGQCMEMIGLIGNMLEILELCGNILEYI